MNALGDINQENSDHTAHFISQLESRNFASGIQMIDKYDTLESHCNELRAKMSDYQEECKVNISPMILAECKWYI